MPIEPRATSYGVAGGKTEDLPDKVLTDIIAKRIVAKKGAEKMTGKKKSGARTLADLARELEWE